MPDDLSKLALARLASGLTLEDAARATGMSPRDYEQAERRPFGMSVGELRALCSELNKDGSKIMHEWMDDLFRL